MQIMIEVTQVELDELKRLLILKVRMIKGGILTSDVSDKIAYRILVAAEMIEKEK